MQAIKHKLLEFGRVELNTVLITVFLSCLVAFNLLIGNYFIILAVVLILSAVFIWKTPQAGFLAALLTTMIFGEHFSLLPVQIEDVVYKIYALDFVLIITAVCWLLKLKAGELKLKKLFKSPADSAGLKKNIWLGIFLGFIILNAVRALIFSTDLSLALGTFKNYIYLLIYWLVILMFNSKEKLLRLIKTFLLGGLFLLIFVVYGWLTGQGMWSEITPGVRYLSGLHAYYLIFSIIILLILMVYKEFIYGRIKTILIFLAQVLGMIGGMFRHLWLGLTAAFLFILSCLKFDKQKNFIKLGLVIFCILIFVGISLIWSNNLLGKEADFLENRFFESVIGRTESLVSSGNLIESAAGWRIQTWKIALDKFLANPLFGIGLGQKFFFDYRGFVDLIDIRNIHNDFAALLVQLGLLGFIPFILFNFYSVKDLFKLLKKEDAFFKPLSLMLSGFYIVSVFGIFFGIYLMFNGTSIFYWTIMGTMAALVNSE